MRYSERRQQEANFHAGRTDTDIVSHHSPWLRDEANDLALAAKQPLPHPHHKPPNADIGERFLYDYFLEQLEREKSANWKAAMLLGNDQLCACPCDKCCTRRLTCPCSVCCENRQISGGDPTSEPMHKQLEAFLRASPEAA